MHTEEPGSKNFVLVMTTVGDDDGAEALAARLVDEQLAACVNVMPSMTSVYRWRGRVEREAERQLVIKTARDRLPELERRVHELHPYELPEFVVVDIEAGSEAYLGWLSAETRGGGGR